MKKKPETYQLDETDLKDAITYWLNYKLDQSGKGITYLIGINYYGDEDDISFFAEATRKE